MKIIKCDLPALTAVSTSVSADSLIGATSLTVLDSTGISANDFILIERRGHEKNEIVKVSVVVGNVLTLATGLIYSHVGAFTVTKATYDKYRIKKSTAGVTYNTLVTNSLLYQDMYAKIQYIDESADASDSIYYKVYYLNSHTSTEVEAAALHNEDNFSFISLAQFRTESTITSTQISDSYLYDALNAGVEYIRDQVFNRRVLYGSGPDDTYDISSPLNGTSLQTNSVTGLFIADWNADRQITKDDIVVYEEDPQTLLRIYVNHLIQGVSNDGTTIFFKEQVPTNGKNLIMWIPCSPKPNEEVRSTLKTVNKLYAVNYILMNTTSSSVKDAILQWTAGGTTVNRDPTTVQSVIDKNNAVMKTLINDILVKIYPLKTKLRTRSSSLDWRYGGMMGTGFSNLGGNSFSFPR